MKIVVCENCGAKYQLNDDDDIDAFECSSCTGKLRELETIVDEDSKTAIITAASIPASETGSTEIAIPANIGSALCKSMIPVRSPERCSLLREARRRWSARRVFPRTCWWKRSTGCSARPGAASSPKRSVPQKRRR